MLDLDTAVENPLPKADLPEIVNHTGSPAQYFQSVDPHADVYHTIALKVTYDLSKLSDSGQPFKATPQQPLVFQDTFEGDPSETALLFENDLVPYKPKCDFYLVNAVSYAPKGEAGTDWCAGISLGDHQKVIRVVGPSTLERHLLGYKPLAIQAVTEVPIRYALAFGGTQINEQAAALSLEESIEEYCPRNPLGIGFASDEWIKRVKPKQMAVPQLLDPNRAFDGKLDYPVMGFTPIPKTWEPRRLLAGTYDEDWKRHVWPKLPIDHDYRFWNCAPNDQQVPFPKGGEAVQLLNLYKDCPRIRFFLPEHQYRCLLRLENGVMMFKPFKLDTVRIDMKTLLIHCTYRVAVPAAIDVRVLEVHQELAFEDQL
jgi:hypothetical protein